MTNIALSQWKMKRLYRMPKNLLYTHRFFEDMCSGYTFSLGTQEGRQDFLTLEPATSRFANAYAQKYYNSNYEIERVFSSAIYSLLAYGKAYLYLIIDYPNTNDNEQKQSVMSADIVEYKGFPIRGFGYNNFCAKTYDEKIKMVRVDANALITLDLKDLGLRRNYFRKILKKINRYDITRNDFVTNGVEGYDFSLHARKNRIHLLKLTKNIGWSYGNDELSDSNILYRKIQMEKLQLRMLQYVVESVNDALSASLGEDSGKIVTHVKQRDYDQLWADYSKGNLTLHQLRAILFSHRQ